MPTPIIGSHSKLKLVGLVIKKIDINPKPPNVKAKKCVNFLLVFLAITGNKKATIAAIKL
ncbi:hypothetical protein D1872_330200 [compost metagenome]